MPPQPTQARRMNLLDIMNPEPGEKCALQHDSTTHQLDLGSRNMLRNSNNESYLPFEPVKDLGSQDQPMREDGLGQLVLKIVDGLEDGQEEEEKGTITE